MDKPVAMIMYGALTITFVFIGYVFVGKFIDVSSELGALFGGIIGLILSIALWYIVGKKIVKVATS